MVFSFMRRPDADLSLAIDGDSSLPGDDVMVRVNLSSNKGLKVRVGTATLECVETFWKNEYDAATRTTKLREKSQKLVELTSPVMGEVSVRSGIPLSEEVKFTLSADAHRTVIGGTVNIEWQVKVSLDVPGARDLHEEEGVLVVLERPDARDLDEREQDYASPVVIDDSFDECRLRIELPSSDYRPGDTVEGRLRLDALEECSFPEVRVELIREEKAGDKESGDIVDTTTLESDLNVRAALSREWRFSLAIPDELMPTTSHSKSVLRWKLRGTLARSRRRDYAVEAEIVVS